MGIFRRSRRSTPPLRRKQEEIARQETELREKLEKLERMVTTKQAISSNKSSVRVSDRGATGSTEKRFHVSLALDGAPLDADRSPRRPRALRKVRREGRIIFLFLLMALAAAVMWLISHLHS